jgi:hypothetical protein
MAHSIRTWVTFGAAAGLAAAVGLGACNDTSTTQVTTGSVCPAVLMCGGTCCTSGTCVDGACCDAPCGSICCGGSSPCCQTQAEGEEPSCGANDCGDVCCGGPGANTFCPDPNSAEPTQCVGSCLTSADCNGGCCALVDPVRGLGMCVPLSSGDAGTGGGDPGGADGGGAQTCLCYQNSDCTDIGSCCEPLLSATGAPTSLLACGTVTGEPGPYQCCEWGFTSCPGSYCCVGIGQVNFCSPSCADDGDCGGAGAHCDGASVPDFDFGCNTSTMFCGP